MATFYRLGLIGHPVSHSLSPVMHEAALKHANLEGEYRLIDVPPDELEGRVKSLGDEGFTGFNVTIPHKEAMLKIVEGTTDMCNQVEAVNTVMFENGRMLGHNTDVDGFVRAVYRLLPGDFNSADRAIILGSGGAARAAIVGLSEIGFKHVTVVARNQQKASEAIKSWEKQLSAHPSQSRDFVTELEWRDLSFRSRCSEPVLLVNCTPIGQHSTNVPEWLIALMQSLPSGSLIYDMVYGRGENKTPVVGCAEELGFEACDGLEMLVNQAALAFEFWTGQSVPPEIMKSAVERPQDKQ